METVFCKICSKEFQTKRARLKSGRGKYCSRACFAEACKARPGHWKGKRRETPWMMGDKNAQWRGGHVSSHYARKKGAGGTHTRTEWEALKKSWNYMCLCCKQQEPFVKLVKDHVIPLAVWAVWVEHVRPEFEANSIQNIQPLCGSCNSRKNATFRDYREQYNGTNWKTLWANAV